MSDPAGARLPRWIGTMAIAAMSAAGIVFTPLSAGAAATVIDEFPGPPSLSTPQGITAGSDGNLWFTESTSRNIGQITPAGSITEFTALNGASWWIASGPDGNLWTTESSANQIGELSPAGALVREFPLPTGGFPDQIAPGPDGNMWFTEFNGNQIGRITPAGAITEFPIPTAGAGPVAIVAGSDGNIWFTEQTRSWIGRINPTTGDIKEFGPVGSTPAGMAAGPDGSVWFTEYGASQIGRITMAGVITEYTVTTTGSAPASITAGPDGNLWFTEYGVGKVGVMSRAGEMLGEFALPNAGSGPNAITTGPDRNLWFTEPVTNQIGRLTPGTAIAATAVNYSGPAAGDFNDPVTVSATLTDTSTTPATPVSGQSVTFTLNGAEACSATSDGDGRASCPLTPGETGGTYDLVANFAGTATLNPSSITAPFAVTVEETALTVTAPAATAAGSPVTLNAVLTEDATAPIAGRTIALGLGTGATAQSCTATTGTTGAATCSIAAVNQLLGPGALFASFAGDGFYAPASASGASLSFAFATGGMFVIGDGSAQVGASVTFWSPTWANANAVSGGSGPSSFKGFAPTTTPVATCGGKWTSSGGSSSSPPATPLPAYMAVVVASSVDKSGSTITGNITQIVIVKTDPAYGTGTVVALLCPA